MLDLLNIPSPAARRRTAASVPEVRTWDFPGRSVALDCVSLAAVASPDPALCARAAAGLGSRRAPAVVQSPIPNPQSAMPSCLTLILTTRCNAQCAYCYRRAAAVQSAIRNPQSEMSDAVIDSALSLLDPARPWTINFFGGEPLLNLPALAYAMAQARARAQHGVSFGLTTNGTLLTPGIAERFRGQSVILSLDGPPALHQETRPGTWLAAMAGLRHLAAAGARVTLRATYASAPAYLVERLQHLNALCDLGLAQSVAVEPALMPLPSTAPTLPTASTVAPEYRAASDWFLSRLAQGQPARFAQYEIILRRLLRREHALCECSAGGNYVAVDPSGQVWPCHIQMPAPINPQSAIRNPQCPGCWARWLCGGGCQVHRTDAYCAYMRLWCTEVLYVASALTPAQRRAQAGLSPPPASTPSTPLSTASTLSTVHPRSEAVPCAL